MAPLQYSPAEPHGAESSPFRSGTWDMVRIRNYFIEQPGPPPLLLFPPPKSKREVRCFVKGPSSEAYPHSDSSLFLLSPLTLNPACFHPGCGFVPPCGEFVSCVCRGMEYVLIRTTAGKRVVFHCFLLFITARKRSLRGPCLPTQARPCEARLTEFNSLSFGMYLSL